MTDTRSVRGMREAAIVQMRRSNQVYLQPPSENNLLITERTDLTK